MTGDVASVNSLIDKMVAQKKTILIEDSETGLSPLLRIARFGDSAEVLARKMLDVGGEPRRDVNYQGLLDKKTPLHVAAEHGQANFMKLILDRGADPMIREAEGRSALHSAVHSNKIAAVIALLEHPKVVMKKLDLIQICDNHGRTALHIAAFRCNRRTCRVHLVATSFSDRRTLNPVPHHTHLQCIPHPMTSRLQG